MCTALLIKSTLIIKRRKILIFFKNLRSYLNIVPNFLFKYFILNSIDCTYQVYISTTEIGILIFKMLWSRLYNVVLQKCMKNACDMSMEIWYEYIENNFAISNFNVGKSL